MRISDWSSDVCSSDLLLATGALAPGTDQFNSLYEKLRARFATLFPTGGFVHFAGDAQAIEDRQTVRFFEDRSEEHTSELQSLMRISYAVFCLKKKTKKSSTKKTHNEKTTTINRA